MSEWESAAFTRVAMSDDATRHEIEVGFCPENGEEVVSRLRMKLYECDGPRQPWTLVAQSEYTQHEARARHRFVYYPPTIGNLLVLVTVASKTLECPYGWERVDPNDRISPSAVEVGFARH